MVTVDKATLLAFVYYDTTHTGYIVDKDLEEMFFTLGLQVSRSQVRFHQGAVFILSVCYVNSTLLACFMHLLTLISLYILLSVLFIL